MLLVAIMSISNFAYAVNDPSAVLSKAVGDVTYSKDGQKWKKVRRNKFLYQGYQVRVNGSCMVCVQKDDKCVKFGSGSKFIVTEDGLAVTHGDFESMDDQSRMMSGLMKRFTKAQVYTTVRRSSVGAFFKPFRTMTLSDKYPKLYLHKQPNSTYEVTVGDYIIKGDDIYDDEDIVIVKVPKFDGSRFVSIKIIRDGKSEIFNQYRSIGQLQPITVSWNNEIDAEANKILRETDNFFLVGSYYESQGAYVAALDNYYLYLNDTGEIEMTPYAFRLLKKLNLTTYYKNELEKWKQKMLE